MPPISKKRAEALAQIAMPSVLMLALVRVLVGEKPTLKKRLVAKLERDREVLTGRIERRAIDMAIEFAFSQL